MQAQLVVVEARGTSTIVAHAFPLDDEQAVAVVVDRIEGVGSRRGTVGHHLAVKDGVRGNSLVSRGG